jgi:hypothetical protein
MGGHGYCFKEIGFRVIDIPPLELNDLADVCEEYNRVATLTYAEYIPSPLYPSVRLSANGKALAFRDQEQRRWELAAQTQDEYQSRTVIAINHFERILHSVARKKFLRS